MDERNSHHVEFTYQTVSMKEVDLTDETFKISYGFTLEALKRSIEKVGLINPLILYKGSHGMYRIVCGFQRILALSKLSYPHFPAALVPEKVSEKNAFLISLSENLSHRMLNPVEIAIVIHKLKRYFTLKEIQDEFLPLLGAGKALSLITMYESILELEGEIKMGLAKGEITKEIVPMLLRFSAPERILLSQLIIRLKLSRSKQVEIVENITVIKERERVALDTILQGGEVGEILSDQRVGLVAQGDRIRDYLRKLRYPQLTKAEEDFREKRERLKLKGIALIPPPSFEGQEFQINFSFTTLAELKKRIALLQAIADKEEFREIIEG